MSSSSALFSDLQSLTTTFYTSEKDYYSGERQFNHLQQRHTLPLSTTNVQALDSTRRHSPDVIARRPDSCMQSNFAWTNAVNSSQGQEPVRYEHGSNGNVAVGYWPSIPRSVQPEHLPVDASWMQSTGSDNSSMGGPGLAIVNGLKRQNSHQRASSTSTIASNGPASPADYSNFVPHIANTDVPPFEHSLELPKENYFAQQITTNPAYLSANYLPQQFFNKSSGGQRFYEFTQDFTGQPMSNLERASASTASSISEESEARQQRQRGSGSDGALGKRQQDGPLVAEVENRSLLPQVQLSRTESAAYQDELYNPANFTTGPRSATQPTRPHVTTPAARGLVNQYLESANMARSASPNSAVSRERSPFREGSELAPSEAWSPSRNPIQTAASRRQQIKYEREQAELAAHRPQLQREPTKTISPKEALLDYTEDQPPLMQDLVPAGYKQHFGGTEPYADASSALKTASSNLPTSNPQDNMAGFRAVSSDAFTTPTYAFSPPASQQANQATMQNPYQMGAYQHLTHLDPAYAAVSLAEPTPQFPATLLSMESSISDQTPAMSSQDSNITGITRPVDTRANGGTYTCTSLGCAQRFGSPASLQRHKKDFHRSQQQQARDNLSVEAASESPRSTASPGPSGSGLTSAQILARNSQAGPHKCSRTNPSTGKPCNTVFSRPYDLTRHEETIHNGRKHKVRCPYCREEKTFSRNDALTRHMRVVHPDVENYGKRGRRGE